MLSKQAYLYDLTQSIAKFEKQGYWKSSTPSSRQSVQVKKNYTIPSTTDQFPEFSLPGNFVINLIKLCRLVYQAAPYLIIMEILLQQASLA